MILFFTAKEKEFLCFPPILSLKIDAPAKAGIPPREEEIQWK
jgi:hypothetical protein